MPPYPTPSRALSYLLLFFALGSAFYACQPGTSSTNIEGRVVGVSDGDSLKILIDGRPEVVRLAGIDCPEKGQAFGAKARQFTSDLAFDKTVRLSIVDHDRYGRSVGSVLLPNGKELNSELIRVGLAWWYRSFAPERADYRRLESAARREKRGLWSDPSPVPPWDWRKNHPRRKPR